MTDQTKTKAKRSMGALSLTGGRMTKRKETLIKTWNEHGDTLAVE
jgi:hypothetical protein